VTGGSATGGMSSLKRLRASRFGRIGLSVGLKLIGAAIAFIWQLFTLRILGPSAGGLVAVVQSQMRLIGTTGALGRDRSLSLTLPLAESQAAIEQRVRQAQRSGSIATSVILVAVFVSWTVTGNYGWQSLSTLILTIIGALTFCLLVGAAGAARGLHAPLAADLGFTILPLSLSSVMFALIGAWYGWTLFLALICLVSGQAVALLYFRIVMQRSLQNWTSVGADNHAVDERSSKARRLDQLAIAVCTTFSAMYPDALLIIVGYASSSASAAAFGIAVRYIRLARFVPVSFLHVREPALARMWNEGETKRLGNEIHTIATSSFFVSVGILLPLMLFASTFLGIFGHSFAAFESVLRFVVLAELINSLALMPTSMLLIGGLFRGLATINLCVYLSGLIISAFAIVAFGGEGAAVVLVGTNLLLAGVTSSYCFRRMGIRADAISSCAILIRNKIRLGSSGHSSVRHSEELRIPHSKEDNSNV